MERSKRAPKKDGPLMAGCDVCGARDARLLVKVELANGGAATLCGSHALMLSRTGSTCSSAVELRSLLGERRFTERRAKGEGDELAEHLTAAFTRDRRGIDRRAS